jgi:hypothetical protein
MNTRLQERSKTSAAAIGCVLTLLAGVGPTVARAQQPAPPPASTAQPGWYGYIPGQGWVSYAPSSSPATVTSPPAPATPAAPVPPGWLAYSPATGWVGYAPASAPIVPAVTPPLARVYPPGPARRRAANLAVNHIAPRLAYAIPAYREYGTGRDVPLAKPWLPPSP